MLAAIDGFHLLVAGKRPRGERPRWLDIVDAVTFVDLSAGQQYDAERPVQMIGAAYFGQTAGTDRAAAGILVFQAAKCAHWDGGTGKDIERPAFGRLLLCLLHLCGFLGLDGGRASADAKDDRQGEEGDKAFSHSR